MLHSTNGTASKRANASGRVVDINLQDGYTGMTMIGYLTQAKKPNGNESPPNSEGVKAMFPKANMRTYMLKQTLSHTLAHHGTIHKMFPPLTS